jgi:hypothetical protein
MVNAFFVNHLKYHLNFRDTYYITEFIREIPRRVEVFVPSRRVGTGCSDDGFDNFYEIIIF